MIEMFYILALASKFAMVDYPVYRSAADTAADAAYIQSGARGQVESIKNKATAELVRTGKEIRHKIVNAGISDKAIRTTVGSGAFIYKIYKDQGYSHTFSNVAILGGIPYIRVGLSEFTPNYAAGGIDWTWRF